MKAFKRQGEEITFKTTIGGGKHSVQQYDPKEIHCPQHQLLLMIALQMSITTSCWPQEVPYFHVSANPLLTLFTFHTTPSLRCVYSAVCDMLSAANSQSTRYVEMVLNAGTCLCYLRYLTLRYILLGTYL